MNKEKLFPALLSLCVSVVSTRCKGLIIMVWLAGEPPVEASRYLRDLAFIT